mmetsp:Transcript_32305/g.70496  ORF Transcript_32305/g.70496 Transcript_32305/m.70496 type:complete len:262 (-) Transcript_32305:463-1248(-)
MHVFMRTFVHIFRHHRNTRLDNREIVKRVEEEILHRLNFTESGFTQSSLGREEEQGDEHEPALDGGDKGEEEQNGHHLRNVALCKGLSLRVDELVQGQLLVAVPPREATLQVPHVGVPAHPHQVVARLQGAGADAEVAADGLLHGGLGGVAEDDQWGALVREPLLHLLHELHPQLLPVEDAEDVAEADAADLFVEVHAVDEGVQGDVHRAGDHPQPHRARDEEPRVHPRDVGGAVVRRAHVEEGELPLLHRRVGLLRADAR